LGDAPPGLLQAPDARTFFVLNKDMMAFFEQSFELFLEI
jgi:hypothetical protein